jgi:sugar/nucleoside kinase (ribokinase family)
MAGFLAIGECMIEIAPSDVALFTRGGTDKQSDRMLAFMEANGISTTFIARDAERHLGQYMINVDQGERSFTQLARAICCPQACWLADAAMLASRTV